MNISIIEISKAVEKGLGIGEFIYLKMVDDGCLYLINSEKLKPYYNGLFMEGYVIEDKITEKGKGFLKSVEENDKVSKKVDNWYVELHKKLENELITLTKNKQKKVNGGYSFLCNSKDLEYKLSKVIKKYKLEDKTKIEKLLLKHIFNCHKANWQFCKLVEYYIEKSYVSQLASDYGNFEDKEIIEVKENIEPKEIKNLF